MKLSTASAILCTALLASFCNAFPYLDYWDREAFLDQLQQEEHMGTDVEARIEQAGECQRPRIIKEFNLENTNISTIQSTLDFSSGEVIGAKFIYECALGYMLFVSRDGGVSFQMSPTPNITYKCTFEAESYQPSINTYGIPSCFSLCPVLSIPNGNVDYGNRPREPDSKATYNCSGDHKLQGERKRTCGRDGRWSGEDPKCVLPRCPELQDIANGRVRLTSREPGATARYSCDPEYDLSGAETRTCNPDGTWSDQEPTCKKQCPDPTTVFNFTNADPSNLRLVVDIPTGNILGSEFDYKCRSGFVLFVSKNGGAYERAPSDSITYECLRRTGSTFDPSIEKNGHPKCFPLCPELPSVSNGAVNFTSREPGATATYSCDPEYNLSGAETRTCQQDGMWSGQEPTCEKQCPDPSTVFNFTNADPSSPRVVVDIPTGNILGNEFDYKCRSGFVLFISKNGGASYERAPSDSITYECRRTTGSTFDPSIEKNGQPKCFPLCPIPSLPNGEVIHGNREPGDVARYSCRSGYRLEGLEERECHLNGTWSGEEPVCEEIFCLENSIPSGDTDPIPLPSPVPSPTGIPGYRVGTVITYTCATDFKLRGESKRTCLENGTFDHPQPFCSPVKCRALNTSDIPNNYPEVKRELREYVNIYGNLILFKEYYNRRIEGDRFEGSKAYLTCMNGWKLMKGTPAVQTCVSENGALVWTEAGTCVYTYKKINHMVPADV